MPYDAVKDFAPISLVAITPNVLVVNAALPVNSLKDLIAYAKANPGKVNFGSGSNGSAGHLAGELFKVETGTDVAHIPFKGGAPATQALSPATRSSCSTTSRTRWRSSRAARSRRSR